MLKGNRQKLHTRFTLIFLAFLTVFCSITPSVAAYNEDLWVQNNIIGYDPNENLDNSDCPPGTAGYNLASTVSGDSNAAKVWNLIVDAGIDGISNRAEVIAGIMGNIDAESGFNPFDLYDERGYKYYGLYQSQANEGVKTAVETALAGKSGWSWGASGVSQELQDIAIAATIDVLLNGTGNAFDARFKNFKNCIDTCVTNTSGESGARSYTELFEVTVEIAYCWTLGSRCNAVEDPKVRDYVYDKLYPSGNKYHGIAGYQDLEKRRTAAVKYFNEFSKGQSSASSSSSSTSSGTTSDSTSSSTTSGSNVTIIGDSITEGAKSALESALPGVDVIAQSSKQFASDTDSGGPSGITILQDLIDQNKLRDIVVFALGTNNVGLTESQAQKVVDLVGPDRTLIFVNNRTHDNDYTGNNNVFTKMANDNSNVKVADYKSAIEQNLDDNFNSNDETHPNSTGQAIYVNTIVNAVKGADAIQSAPASCKSSSSSSGKIEGGLTNEQAQVIVDFYKSNKVTNGEWHLPSSYGKWNCVSLVAYFMQRFTSIGKVTRQWHDGRLTAHYLKKDLGLETGTEPRPFAIFSITQGRQDCKTEDGKSIVKCGHTGVIVNVDGDKITYIEAAYGDVGYTEVKTKYLSSGYFVNKEYPEDLFAYTDNIINMDELNKFLTNPS